MSSCTTFNLSVTELEPQLDEAISSFFQFRIVLHQYNVNP